MIQSFLPLETKPHLPAPPTHRCPLETSPTCPAHPLEVPSLGNKPAHPAHPLPSLGNQPHLPCPPTAVPWKQTLPAPIMHACWECIFMSTLQNLLHLHLLRMSRPSIAPSSSSRMVLHQIIEYCVRMDMIRPSCNNGS